MLLIILKLVIFVLGLCLGSFLNVVIHRLPREDVTIASPRRSICPACREPIAWYDNLPLISYLILRGRCRHCRRPISPRYPLVELMAGIMTLAVFQKAGILGQTPFDWVALWRMLADLYLVLALIAITFIDLDEMIIPDAITLPGMVLAILAAVAAPEPNLLGPWLGGKVMDWGIQGPRMMSFLGSLFGLCLGGALIWVIFQAYYLLRKEEGIGGGDFTLLAMIGAFLGWRSVLVTIFIASLAGLAAAIASMAKGKGVSLQMKVPFGPFLAFGALVYLFFGESLVVWYWSLGGGG